MGLIGGIDLGGTKIEAGLFDDQLKCLQKQRIGTPSDYPSLLIAITEQVGWVRDQAGQCIPVGLGCPGFFNDDTGLACTVNLAAHGKPFKFDLATRNEQIFVGQDLKCFTLSEANGGAGDGQKHVFGLVFGTGLGGAFCINGNLVTGQQGILGEIGHIPVSANAAARYGLPEVNCGCGRSNCLETWVAGPGLTRLADHFGMKLTSPREIAEAEKSGDQFAGKVMDAWLDLACETLLIVQLSIDPDCIIVGGGLSRIKGIDTRLAEHFAVQCLPGSKPPEIKPAKFGDSSGTRGAALLAKQWNDQK